MSILEEYDVFKRILRNVDRKVEEIESQDDCSIEGIQGEEFDGVIIIDAYDIIEDGDYNQTKINDFVNRNDAYYYMAERGYFYIDDAIIGAKKRNKKIAVVHNLS